MIDNEKEIYKNTMKELSNIREIINNNSTNRLAHYLQKYSIMMASATIEQLFKKVIDRIVTSDSNPLIKQYFYSTFTKNSYNSHYKNMCKVINKIDDTNISNNIKEIIAKKKSYNIDITQLNSLISNRNNIAHENSDTIISINDIINAFFSGIKIILLIEYTLYKAFPLAKPEHNIRKRHSRAKIY